MISCAEMAEILEAAALTAKAELAVPTEELMVLLEAEAKHFIGHYQEGWDPLAPSTIKEKTDLGYAPPDNPLLARRGHAGFDQAPICSDWRGCDRRDRL